MDDFVEHLTRMLAQRTSRRGLLGLLGKIAIAEVALPLLPIRRLTGEAHAGEPGAMSEPGDPMSCDYWRYCGFDGNLCGCCGGSTTECPPGTTMSPTGWVGTCKHPGNGKDYIIAYRDCCGKEMCARCSCTRNEGDTPIYRTQTDNAVVWCFGSKTGYVVNCTTAVNLGLKT
jgi:methylamine dehydrogenase light chain